MSSSLFTSFRSFQTDQANSSFPDLRLLWGCLNADEVAKCIRVKEADQVCSLEETKLTVDEMDRIEKAFGASCVLTDFTWVHFPQSSTDKTTWFLKRDDAQLLA
jgi:hypothetical protein